MIKKVVITKVEKVNPITLYINRLLSEWTIFSQMMSPGSGATSAFMIVSLNFIYLVS